MIIAVDFDGTVVRSNYPAIIGEQPYAAEVLKELHEQGHYLILWTCRTGRELLDAINWSIAHGIHFDRINDHNPDNVAQYGDGGNKIYADIYIDDKNLHGFPGWISVREAMKEHAPDHQLNDVLHDSYLG